MRAAGYVGLVFTASLLATMSCAMLVGIEEGHPLDDAGGSGDGDAGDADEVGDTGDGDVGDVGDGDTGDGDVGEGVVPARVPVILEQMTFDGDLPSSSPAACGQYHAALHVFYRTAKGTLFHRYRKGGAPEFWDTEDLGGDLVDDLTTVSWGGIRVDVFGVDRKTKLLAHMSYAAGIGWYPTWLTLPGAALGRSPTVTSRAQDQLDVFAGTEEGALVGRKWTGLEWTSWTTDAPRESGLQSAPAVASPAERPIDVKPEELPLDLFFRGVGDQLLHRRWDGGAWSETRPLGEVTERPAAVFRGSELVVVGRAPSGKLRIWRRAGFDWSSPWSAPVDVSLRAAIDGSPSIAWRGGPEFEVVYRGTDMRLQYARIL